MYLEYNLINIPFILRFYKVTSLEFCDALYIFGTRNDAALDLSASTIDVSLLQKVIPLFVENAKQCLEIYAIVFFPKFEISRKC